ncbi:helix-turn-helix domain protein [bacterium BMS3Abin02]|nr:helix-turn-helix domain protein [bacterium BMS3Abin02]GBE23530.1 helix-turn-helix domain protein [bacterium BMS3Bbin01]HDH27184.1 DNA-binding protein [Actinomycetota bacterium]
MDNLDRLLSVGELAAYLDIPVATLYAWRYRSQGPPGFRVGRHIRYRRSDIEAWIDEQLKDSSDDGGLVSQPRGRVGSRRDR